VKFLVDNALSRLSEGCIAIFEERRIRVRPLPIGQDR
jgi:hypothetical protein